MPFYVEWREYLWKRDILQNNDGPTNVSLSEPFNFRSDIFQIALRKEASSNCMDHLVNS